jgi:hypothetical protein
MRTATTFSLLVNGLVSDGVMVISCCNEWKEKHKVVIVPWPIPFNGETVLVAIVLTTFKCHHKEMNNHITHRWIFWNGVYVC